MCIALFFALYRIRQTTGLILQLETHLKEQDQRQADGFVELKRIREALERGR
jgi:hypothetical protein